MNNKLNQQGQTLIFVLLVMTISLAVGISISSRTISSVRRTVNVDSSTRAVAAAEAALEYYLSKSVSSLNALSGLSGNTNCASTFSGTYPIPPISLSNDGVLTNANITVQRYGCLGASATSPYYDINQDGILELKTGGGSGTLTLCWHHTSGSTYSAIYLMEISGSAPSYSVRKVGINEQGSPYSSLNNFKDPTTFVSPNDSCYSYTLRSSTKLLRILSLYNTSSLKISTSSGSSLPYQGFQMTAVGKVGSDVGARRTVTASKSLPYLPTPFNFAVYSNSSSEALD